MSKLLLNFENQYILITGGTRGIGKATAGLFRQQGAKVIVTGTGIDCPSNLRSEWGDDFDYIQADFSSKEGIQNFIYLLDNYQRIDVCINNAGVNRLSGIEDVSEDDYEMMLSVNLHAPFSICRYMASKMKKQGYGRVVNIAYTFSIFTFFYLIKNDYFHLKEGHFYLSIKKIFNNKKYYYIVFFIFCFCWNIKTVISDRVGSFPIYRIITKSVKILINY